MRYLLVLLLTGCSTVFDPPQRPQILYPRMTVVVSESKNLKYEELGTATIYPKLKLCIVQLRRYPRCLQHEMRHCIEGNWHGDAPNDEDCDG